MRHIIGLFAIALIILFLWRMRPRHGRQRKAVRGIIAMSSKQLNVGDVTTAHVAFKDKAGEPVTLPEGSIPVWSVDQGALATVEPEADGMSALVTALAVGLATVTVVAEGDPTPGVDTITVTASINIVDEASTGEITFG